MLAMAAAIVRTTYGSVITRWARISPPMDRTRPSGAKKINSATPKTTAGNATGARNATSNTRSRYRAITYAAIVPASSESAVAAALTSTLTRRLWRNAGWAATLAYQRSDHPRDGRDSDRGHEDPGIDLQPPRHRRVRRGRAPLTRHGTPPRGGAAARTPGARGASGRRGTGTGGRRSASRRSPASAHRYAWPAPEPSRRRATPA